MAANGVDRARSASLVAGADAGVEWRTGRDVPPLVPAVSTRATCGTESCCLSDPVFSGLDTRVVRRGNGKNLLDSGAAQDFEHIHALH